MLAFDLLVAAHVVTGAVGLVTVWVPILGRKGSHEHRRFGRLFARCLLATGLIAIGISICTLIAPLETHPFADDAAEVRAVFGWMMLYLAVLTVNLTLYGRACVLNRSRHDRNRNALNLLLQLATFMSAVNCAAHGLVLGNALLPGIAIVGIAASILNTRFILTASPAPNEWLIQHSRGLVGAGISVYTAFLAFGAVNLMPALAFNPILWATPTVLGVGYLLYHQQRIVRGRRSHARTSGSIMTPRRAPDRMRLG